MSCLQYNSPMKQQGSGHYGLQKIGKEYSTLLANIPKSLLKALEAAKYFSPSVNTYDFPLSVHDTAG